MAVPIVKALIDSATQLGLPEAQIPLAEAVILLCTAPKSNTAISAMAAAMADVRAGHTGEIPAHLRDGHYKGAAQLGHMVGYKLPHDYGGWVEQQYLPDELRDRVYYHFGQNKTEQAALAYRKKQRGRE